MSEKISKEENIRKKWSKWQFKDGVSCIICDAAKLKENTEKALAKCESWEEKKKNQLQEELKELTEIVSDIGDIKCSIKENGDVHSDRIWTEIGATFYGVDEICKECGVTVKKNDYGDIKPIEHKENCQQHQESNDSNQIKSNQIKSNQIKSNQIKSNQTHSSVSQDSSKTNYLPWILGGIGVVGLIGIVVYFLTKKGGKE